jgi:hypothetical protein
LTGDGEFDGVHHMPESQSANRVLTSIAPSSAAKEFIEFWLQTASMLMSRWWAAGTAKPY